MFLVMLLACSTEPPICESEKLFGVPSESTGLSGDQCAPTCSDCGGEPWSPPTYSTADFSQWRSLKLLNPPENLTSDPYADPLLHEDAPDAVCAVIREGESYKLQDFESSTAAKKAKALPTHFGHCGLCSSLADLAVYAEQPELTEPVRACGLEHLSDPAEAHVACLEEFGFTTPCAWIWYYNTINTRKECAAPCFAALDQPWHQADGSLNECLQCDEDKSGPVFKEVAGRTRRNTGLPSTICRPCTEVRPLEHHY